MFKYEIKEKYEFEDDKKMVIGNNNRKYVPPFHQTRLHCFLSQAHQPKDHCTMYTQTQINLSYYAIESVLKSYKNLKQ